MMTSERKRTCFVIMPFGEKKDFDNQDIDFDDIYRFFLKKVIEELEIKCIRCDEIEEAGSIHEKMFEHIHTADVVVVDITTSNANVYYELGVRHTLAKRVTVLIRRKGTNMPFNIQNLEVVEYDQAKFGSIEQARARIHRIIKNGLNQKKIDSPIHSILSLNIEPEGKPIPETNFYEVQLANDSEMTIGLVTGDIQNVKGIDVWVNSENTNMQMGRPFENSISGIIRYHGAEKEDGQIVKDTIFQELTAKLNGKPSVNAGEILVTSSGAMSASHEVKRIFHAAAVIGEVGKGYAPIQNVATCVVNALRAAKLKDCAGHELKSILFPLFGARSNQGNVLEAQVKPLLDAAINYLDRNPHCPFKKVYFLTYTDKEFEVCQGLLRGDSRLKQPPRFINTSSGKPNGEVQVAGNPASPPLAFSPTNGLAHRTQVAAEASKPETNHATDAAPLDPGRITRKTKSD